MENPAFSQIWALCANFGYHSKRANTKPGSRKNCHQKVIPSKKWLKEAQLKHKIKVLTLKIKRQNSPNKLTIIVQVVGDVTSVSTGGLCFLARSLVTEASIGLVAGETPDLRTHQKAQNIQSKISQEPGWTAATRGTSITRRVPGLMMETTTLNPAGSRGNQRLW